MLFYVRCVNSYIFCQSSQLLHKAEIVEFSVEVADVNDTVLMFEFNELALSVSKNIAPVRLSAVRAFDADARDNTRVTYELLTPLNERRTREASRALRSLLRRSQI